MAARTDPRIPELVSLTEAAALLDCSKNWITKLHQRGQLTARRVGRTLVFAAGAVRALAAARRDGLDGWQLPAGAGAVVDVALPELLSTTEAADRLGLAQRNWASELYRRGELPGRLVGRRNVVFAADTVAETAEERRVGLHRYLGTNRPD